MKTLRYLLIVLVIALTSMTAKAEWAQVSVDYQFRSTSMMRGSGSTLPQAALTGTMYADGSTTFAAPGRPRRVGENEEFEEEEDPYDTGNTPGEPFPIGDGVWVMLLMAAGLMCYRMVRSRGSLAVGKVVTEAQ